MSGLVLGVELAPGVEVQAQAQAVCPETMEHRRSPLVSGLNIPSRKACQARALMDRWGPCWGSGRTRKSLELLLALSLVLVKGAD